MQQYRHLKSDKKLLKIIEQIGGLKITKRKNVFLWLVRSVAGQQLSTKAAASIFNKFLELVKETTPESILKVSVENLREVGFSYNKANYIQNIATFWLDKNIKDSTFTKMNDSEVIEFLTQIKGVGRWTVEMLLMFTLGRQNVFAVDDLGIQQAMCMLYGWDILDKKNVRIKMLEKAEQYSPTKTLICMYLWKWKDDKKNAI